MLRDYRELLGEVGMKSGNILLLSFAICSYLQTDGVSSQCPSRTEASALCRKPCQTDKDCVTRKNRPRACICDGACGLSCARINMQCVETPPDEPVNGERKFNGRTVTVATVFSVNDVINYSCKKGYTLRGPSELRCSAIGKFKPWDKGTPTCQRSCPDPGVPANGRRNGDSFKAGETVTFRCNPGYILIGLISLTCSNSLTWDGSAPKCDVATCDQPPIPINARIEKGFLNQYLYGDRVLFVCNAGFYRSGFGQIICGQNGWSNIPFKCLAKSCGNPGSPKNGKREGNSFKFLQVVTYSCDVGFELVGAAFQRCQADQTWDGTLPTCERIDCGEPDPLATGRYFGSSTLYGSSYTITCNDGYEPDGPAKITCNAKGEWSSKTSCQRVQCQPIDLANGQVNGLIGVASCTTTYNCKLTFTCDNGYYLSEMNKELLCLQSGQWNGKPPACLAIDCGPPKQLVHGFTKGSRHSYGDVITYVCNSGYRLDVSSSTSQCQANGSWSIGQAKCEPVSCGSPPSIANGRPLPYNLMTYKSTIEYKCDIGYEILAEKQITCRSNGQWSVTPNCQIVSCGTPDVSQYVIANGQTNTYYYGTVLRVKCTRNRKMIGRSYVSCGSDGKWNNSEATCQSDCSEPLGLESEKLKDQSLVATGFHTRRESHFGRLNSRTSWCGSFNHKNQLSFDIKLGKEAKITRIAIQGGRDTHKKEVWPTEVKIWTAFGVKWFDYKVSTINSTSADDIVYISIAPAKVIERVVIIIKQSNTGSHACGRFELYGCWYN